jgi:hypothetical protein
MANSVLLDNVSHQDLRIRTGYSADFGDSVNSCVVFPTEFVYVQREYPIFLRRDANGDLQPMALLGFDKDENLFLEGNEWKARYVPAIQQRGPFMIGLRKRTEDEAAPAALINVDLDHPRISRTDGIPVFLPHGGNSPYLDHVSRVLQLIYQGSGIIRAMLAAFEEHGLVEPVQVEREFGRGTKLDLPGFLTISQEKLAGLEGAALEQMHRAGFLSLAVLVTASLGNIAWLVELKNRKRATAAG